MVNEVILFGDTTALYINYLRDELADRGYTDLHIGTTVPNPRPDTFLRLIRTGGVRRLLVVDETQLTFEAWAATEEVAHDLAQLTRAIVYATRGATIAGTVIYGIGDITGPGSLPSSLVYVPDRISAQPRFTFSMLIATRGDVESLEGLAMASYNFTVKRGDQHSFLAMFADDLGAPLDMTGATLVAQWRPTFDSTTVETFTVTPTANPGEYEFALTAAQTLRMANLTRRGPWDVELRRTGEDPRTLLGGMITFTPDVTRA